jgi:hypothetical protein
VHRLVVVERIAAMFGVTRQRISALLKERHDPPARRLRRSTCELNDRDRRWRSDGRRNGHFCGLVRRGHAMSWSIAL